MNLSEFKSLRIDFQNQGVSAKMFCEVRGIAYPTWAYWSRKLRDQENSTTSTSAFLQVLPEASSDSFTATIESPSGWRVHITASLEEILAALQA
jgi:hypothetical protein